MVWFIARFQTLCQFNPYSLILMIGRTEELVFTGFVQVRVLYNDGKLTNTDIDGNILHQ